MTIRYTVAMVRFGTGCSGRMSDMQHTSPTTRKLTDKTIEFNGWQTKTVSIHEVNKKPIPLIAPKHSFTGHDWWTIISLTQKMLMNSPEFEKMDYLIPALTSDYTGFIPRPATNAQILAVVRHAMAKVIDPHEIWGTTEVGLEPQKITAVQATQKFTLAAMRVFMAEWAYKAGVPRDLRRYIGRWASENTSDTYTREHRQIILKIWNQVTPKRDLMEKINEVPEDLKDPHYWEDDTRIPIMDDSCGSWEDLTSPTKKGRTDDGISEVSPEKLP